MKLTNLLKRTLNCFSGDFYRNRIILACILVFMLFFVNLQAQIFEQDEDTVWDDTEVFRREKKSATTAIIMSSIFPGSGHFYVNRSSLGTYLFPVIEIALWAGYIHFDRKGKDIERDYMAYADRYYERDRQNIAQAGLIDHPQADDDLYHEDHFRLDTSNTQHFYEDIGKYNKYIFGWEDWFNIYYYDNEVDWRFNDDGIWLGNNPTNPDYQDAPNTPYSPLRQKYIDMRQEAQENFDLRVLTTFGLAFNRIIGSLDVIRVTTVYNRELRYTSNIDFSLQPVLVNNKITPTMNLCVKF